MCKQSTKEIATPNDIFWSKEILLAAENLLIIFVKS